METAKLSPINQNIIKNQTQKKIEARQESVSNKNGAKLLAIGALAVATIAIAGISIYNSKNKQKLAQKAQEEAVKLEEKLQHEAQEQINKFKELIAKADELSFLDFEKVGKDFKFADELQEREYLANLYYKSCKESATGKALHEKFAEHVQYPSRLGMTFQNAFRIERMVQNGEVALDDIFKDTSLGNQMRMAESLKIDYNVELPKLNKESIIKSCLNPKVTLDEIKKIIKQDRYDMITFNRDCYADPGYFCLKTKDDFEILKQAYKDKNTDKFLNAIKRIRETLEKNGYYLVWVDGPEAKAFESVRVDFISHSCDLPGIYRGTSKGVPSCIMPGFKKR